MFQEKTRGKNKRLSKKGTCAPCIKLQGRAHGKEVLVHLGRDGQPGGGGRKSLTNLAKRNRIRFQARDYERESMQDEKHYIL